MLFYDQQAIEVHFAFINIGRRQESTVKEIGLSLYLLLIRRNSKCAVPEAVNIILGTRSIQNMVGHRMVRNNVYHIVVRLLLYSVDSNILYLNFTSSLSKIVL